MKFHGEWFAIREMDPDEIAKVQADSLDALAVFEEEIPKFREEVRVLDEQLRKAKTDLVTKIIITHTNFERSLTKVRELEHDIYVKNWCISDMEEAILLHRDRLEWLALQN